MALTVPYTAEINPGAANAVIFGDGTAYPFVREGGIQGLGNPDIREFDTPRGDRDGDVGGLDRNTPRILRFALELDQHATFMADLRALKAAWRSTTDTTLDIRHPLFDSTDNILRFYGRPRTLEANVDTVDLNGFIPVLATYKCLDPFGYGAEETVSDASSPASVTSDGDVPTDRFTIEVTGNGGTPVITSTTDEASAVVFNTTLAGAAVAVLDFRAHSMTVGGTPAYQLAAGSRWFRLLPGANTLTFTGCASIEVVHRPAFL